MIFTACVFKLNRQISTNKLISIVLTKSKNLFNHIVYHREFRSSLRDFYYLDMATAINENVCVYSCEKQWRDKASRVRERSPSSWNRMYMHLYTRDAYVHVTHVRHPRMCRYHTDARVVTENIEKAVRQIFLPQNAPAARDIFRYTLHGKFHREIYRMRVAFRAGFHLACSTVRKYQPLTLADVLMLQYRDKK